MVHNGGRLLSREYKRKCFDSYPDPCFQGPNGPCTSRPELMVNYQSILDLSCWPFESEEKEIVAKSYIGVQHFIKFFKLDYKSVDDFFLSKFQSQIQHLVPPKEREWYSFERCRR